MLMPKLVVAVVATLLAGGVVLTQARHGKAALQRAGFLAAPAWPGEPEQRPGAVRGPARAHDEDEDLGLDESQRQQLRETFERHRDGVRQALQATRAARSDLRRLLLAGTPGDAALRDAAARLGELEGEVAVTTSRMVGELRSYLTAEQDARLSEHLEAREYEVGSLRDVLGRGDRGDRAGRRRGPGPGRERGRERIRRRR